MQGHRGKGGCGEGEYTHMGQATAGLVGCVVVIMVVVVVEWHTCTSQSIRASHKAYMHLTNHTCTGNCLKRTSKGGLVFFGT